MACYVDRLIDYSGRVDYRYKVWCHLVADTDDELLAYAAELGISGDLAAGDPRLGPPLRPPRPLAPGRGGARGPRGRLPVHGSPHPRPARRAGAGGGLAVGAPEPALIEVPLAAGRWRATDVPTGMTVTWGHGHPRLGDVAMARVASAGPAAGVVVVEPIEPTEPERGGAHRRGGRRRAPAARHRVQGLISPVSRTRAGPGGPRRRQRQLHDEAKVGRPRRHELLVLEVHRAHDGVAEPADAAVEAGHVVAGPPRVELGAHRPQPGHELDDGGIVADRRGLGPELREHLAGLVLPVDDQLTGLGQGEHDPHQVALRRVEAGQGREEPSLRGVPGQVVPGGAEQVGGRRVERAQQALGPVGDVRPGGAARLLRVVTGQLGQVVALHGIELEHTGQRVEHVGGHVDGTALFQPGVPTDRHTGQERHLLAAQTGRAAAGAGHQPDLVGGDGGAPHAEELGEVDPARHLRI